MRVRGPARPRHLTRRLSMTRETCRDAVEGKVIVVMKSALVGVRQRGENAGTALLLRCAYGFAFYFELRIKFAMQE